MPEVKFNGPGGRIEGQDAGGLLVMRRGLVGLEGGAPV